MEQRFREALIGVLITNVLAHNADIDLVEWMLDFFDEVVPRLQVALTVRELQAALNLRIQAFVSELKGYLVNVVDVLRGDDGFLGNATEKGNLFLDFLRYEVVCPAQQNIGLDADFTKFLNRVLCGFGL